MIAKVKNLSGSFSDRYRNKPKIRSENRGILRGEMTSHVLLLAFFYPFRRRSSSFLELKIYRFSITENPKFSVSSPLDAHEL